MISQRHQFCIERGDIYLLRLGSTGNGQAIKQPVLVVQNDIGNRYCNTIIVVPLYPHLQLKRLLLGVTLPAGGGIGLAADHIALFTQIRTVDRSFFSRDNYLGRPDEATMHKIDEAIKLSLGLSTVQRLQTKQQQQHKWHW